MATPDVPLSQTDFVNDAKFNQLTYETEIWLDNSGGNGLNRRWAINPNSIINLTIQETLANWITKGTLTLMYVPDKIYGLTQTGKPENYVFRNDGLDLLRIRYVPKIKPDGRGYPVTDAKFWTLSYLFSIYDREEIDLPLGELNAATNKQRCLKLYFWDCWYQRLSTRVLQYSTGMSPQKEEDLTLDNGRFPQGVLPTGTLIKELIETGLGDTGIQGSPGFDIDSSLNPIGSTGLSTPGLFNYPPVTSNSLDWDEGASKLFFTTQTGQTMHDAIMYVYNKHVSSVFVSPLALPGNIQPPSSGQGQPNAIHDFCLLTKERGPEPGSVGQFVLRPMSSYFANAGKNASTPGVYQIEHFYLQSYFDNDSPSKVLRAPQNNSSDTVDISSPAYSYISNYRFVDIAAVTNSQNFCNRPVHSFDHRQRVWTLEQGNNNVQSARKLIADNYIGQLYKTGSSNEKLFLVNIEDEKIDKNFKPIFSPDGDNSIIRQNLGLQKLLKIGVFQNACINFRTLGLSCRESGRFIAIDKQTGVDSGDFEDKFFGQWFVIDIKHIFESEIYYNDITAIKVHRFAPTPTNMPGTI